MLLVGNLLSRGVGIVLVPLYTGHLAGPELFNYWDSLLLAATLVSMLAAQGITAALMWMLKTGGGRGRELAGAEASAAVAAATGWSLLAALVLCGGAAAVAEPLAGTVLATSGYGTALGLLLLSQGLRVATYPAEGVLKLRFRTLPLVLMSFGEFLIQLVGTIVAIVVLDAGLTGMAWAALAAAAVRFGLGLLWLPEMRRPRLDLALVRPMLAYGLPLMPGALASMVLSLSDRWFFNALGLARDGGVYAFGDKWARMVEILLVTPLVAMWPSVYFNMAREPDAARQFGRVATLWVGLGGSLAFALTMAGPALTALFDLSEANDYAGAARAIGVLATGYVVVGLVEVARVSFAVSGTTRRTALAMVAGATANVSLNALLIPRLGTMGAAWSMLLAWLVTLAVALGLARAVLPQRWQWGRLLHAGGLLAGAAWATGTWGPAPGEAGFAATRLAAAAGAPLLLLATGFLTADEWRALRSLVAGLWARVPFARRS